MKKIFRVVIALGAGAVLMLAQKPKSQKEVDAIMAVQNAQTPDARISAVENLITKFADTEFKGWAFNIAGESAQAKNDSAKATFYFEKAIEADAKNYNAMLSLAAEIANHTRENDLDKEDKLARAEKFAKGGLALVPSAAKPNPQVPDVQWDNYKKDQISQGHLDLGMIAMVRKKYDVAITEFKTSVDGAATPDASTMVRLGAAYNDAGKPDDAIATLDKVLAMEAPAAVKNVANSEKARAQKAKAAK
jgi:tetratricopeptide (TPR) repeat protein